MMNISLITSATSRFFYHVINFYHKRIRAALLDRFTLNHPHSFSPSPPQHLLSTSLIQNSYISSTKTDKTISQVHIIGPKWPNFEAGNINSAISSKLVRYHYHCPISNLKRNSWETKKSWTPSHPRKKCFYPYFPLKKSVGPPILVCQKNPRPLFSWKKVLDPFFLPEKMSPPSLLINLPRVPHKFWTTYVGCTYIFSSLDNWCD